MQTRSQTRKLNLKIDTNVNKLESLRILSSIESKDSPSDLLDIDNLYIMQPPILPIYEVNLNFDESINAWRENKESTGPGHYKYICVCKTKSGTQCKNKPMANLNTCVVHSR